MSSYLILLIKKDFYIIISVFYDFSPLTLISFFYIRIFPQLSDHALSDICIEGIYDIKELLIGSSFMALIELDNW